MQGAPRVARARAAARTSRTSSKSRRLRALVATSIARARHRHGRGRPRRSRSSRRARWPRAAAHRAGRPPGRRAEHAARSSRSTAATCSRPRSSCERMRDGLDRGDALPAQPARRARPADRGRCARSTSGTSTSSPRSCGARRQLRRALRRRVRRGARPARRAATRPTSSPSCGRASCGTASTARVRARDGAQRLAVTSGGTIPDRGLFGVFLPDGTRVGELDEEMVYESRPGETFVLGASTWRIEDITHERGDRHARRPASRARCRSGTATARAGRSSSAGRSARSCASCATCPTDDAVGALRDAPRPRRARRPRNLVALPRRAGRGHRRGARRPHDRGRAVPRRDRRLARLRAHARSARGCTRRGRMALRGAAAERLGARRRGDVERRRHRPAPARGGRRAPDRRAAHRPRRDRRARRRRGCRARRCSRPGSARPRPARCCCPRRRPGERTPLWQQRQKAADLLAVAAELPDFPILLETTRECLQRRVRPAGAPRGARATCESRKVRVVAVDTPRPSPFAQSLLFGWIAGVHVRGRRAARRAAGRRARARPRPAARAARRRGAARAARPRGAGRRSSSSCSASARRSPRPRSPTSCTTCSRDLGDLSDDELARAIRRRRRRRRRVARATLRRRTPGDPDRDRRRGAGRPRPRTRRGSATRSAPRIPLGLPGAFTDPVADPLDDLVARYARTHGPFLAADVARRFGIARRPRAATRSSARGRRPRRARRVPARRHSSGSGATSTCCASSGGARSPRCGARSSRSTPRRSPGSCPRGRAWPRRGAASTRWSSRSASSRARRSRRRCSRPTCCRRASAATGPAYLDALCAAGEVVWVGAGARRRRRPGAPVLPRPGRAAAPAAVVERPEGAGARRAPRRSSRARGASFWPELVAPRPAPADDAAVLAALWDLVWAGEVTNDSLAPLRAVPRRAVARNGAAPGGRRPGRLTPARPAGRRGALVARRTAARAGARRPPSVAHAAAPAAARALRRGHPRSGARRRHRGRVRRRCTRCSRRSRSAAGAPRLLRRRARRRAVRAARRGRPRCAPSTPDPDARRIGARGHRSRPAVRRGAGLARTPRRRRRRPRAPARPSRSAARSWCSATARRSRSSTRAAATRSRSTSTTSTGSRVAPGGRARRARPTTEIQRVNGVTVRSTPVAAALEHAGFVPTPRGVVLRS